MSDDEVNNILADMIQDMMMNSLAAMTGCDLGRKVVSIVDRYAASSPEIKEARELIYANICEVLTKEIERIKGEVTVTDG